MDAIERRRRLQRAVVRGDGPALITLVGDGPTTDDPLQLIGDGLLIALAQNAGGSAEPTVRCASLLRDRSWHGDDLLAQQLVAALGEPAVPTLKPLPLDLGDLADILEGDPVQGGGRIDLRTGEVWHQATIDYAREMGEEDEDDSDEEHSLSRSAMPEGYSPGPATTSHAVPTDRGTRGMSEQPRIWLPPRFGRRQLFITAGAAAALAACGSDDNGASPTTASATTGGGGTDSTAAPAAQTTAAGGQEPSTTLAGQKKGGTLRVGVVGSTNDLLDGQYIVARADQARMVTGWEPIANYDDDFNVAYTHGLAEEIEVKAPDNFVVRLKQGLEFHNAKTVGAEDLIYSFNRLIDPALGIAPALTQFLDANSFTALDDRTVELKLLTPNVAFLNGLADYGANIVPVDYARFDGDPTTQVGTGAFKLKSFTPGSESVHVRHENYWGESFLDEVQIIDFSDQAALVNALTSGDIDVAIDVPYAQAGSIESNSDLVLLESAAGNWQTITMRVDMAPFDDVRVRQAMRLIVDRDEMVQRVLSGHGRIGNDMYGVLDGSYPKDFAQRTQDIEQAKALLKEAGQEGLTIELFAPDDTAGLPEYATAFAEQAKEAGINVTATVLDGGTYWGAEYTNRVFATSYWSTRPYLNQVAQGALPTATYPETHWPPAGSNFEELYNQAIAETDQAKRYAIIEEMQKLEYEEGGNIIAYFQNLIDGHASYVKGAVARSNLLNFDHFGRGWKNIWLDQ